MWGQGYWDGAVNPGLGNLVVLEMACLALAFAVDWSGNCEIALLKDWVVQCTWHRISPNSRNKSNHAVQR